MDDLSQKEKEVRDLIKQSLKSIEVKLLELYKLRERYQTILEVLNGHTLIETLFCDESLDDSGNIHENGFNGNIEE